MAPTNHTVGNERKADSTQEMIKYPAEKNSAGDLTKKYYLESTGISGLLSRKNAP